jgi:hypothetical protein
MKHILAVLIAALVTNLAFAADNYQEIDRKEKSRIE